MARAAKRGRAKTRRGARSMTAGWRPHRWLRRWLWRAVAGAFLFVIVALLLFRFVNPPITPYIWSERARLNDVTQDWVPMERIAPVMARSAVAAEDSNFCRHWGIDISAVRAAIEAGGNRGASTISQQVVKNVYLWHGRSWGRKAMEAGMTPLMEALWPKRRILEVYLNVAEFDEGVFGVGAASRHYFGVAAADLTATQAARLAAILPAPKARSASQPSRFVQRRAAQIRDGAATIAADGRARCFEGN